MAVVSYLVFPEPGERRSVQAALDQIHGCETVSATNKDLLILLAWGVDNDAHRTLRTECEAIDGIQCMVLTFGEVQPDSVGADPIQIERRSFSSKRES